MLNLTPHAITLICADGARITFEPSGVVARVSTIESVVGSMDVTDPSILAELRSANLRDAELRSANLRDAELRSANLDQDDQGNTNGHRIPIVSRSFGEVTGLVENVPVIVSAMVLSAVPGRPNTFAPDTGDTAIRNENGNIVAVTRLVSA